MSNDKLAVLIDADNAQAACLPELLPDLSQYGERDGERSSPEAPADPPTQAECRRVADECLPFLL